MRVEKWSGWGVFVVSYSQNLAHARQAGVGPMPNRKVWYIKLGLRQTSWCGADARIEMCGTRNACGRIGAGARRNFSSGEYINNPVHFASVDARKRGAYRTGLPARYTLLNYTLASLRNLNDQAIGTLGQAFERSAVEAVADVTHATIAQDESANAWVPTTKPARLDGVSKNTR